MILSICMVSGMSMLAAAASGCTPEENPPVNEKPVEGDTNGGGNGSEGNGTNDGGDGTEGDGTNDGGNGSDETVVAGIGELDETTGYNHLIRGSDGYYVLEAEYTNVYDITGTTYSGQAVGENVIVKDSSGTASNGFFINYLYREGNTVFFDIYADSAASGVTLVLRLAPYYDSGITLNYQKYVVNVASMTLSGDSLVSGNSANIYYKDINLGSNYLSQQNIFVEEGGFVDYTISATVNLTQGYNRISLITNNSDKLSSKGDMGSTAPMIDCIKIKTDAALEMDIWDQYDTLKV